MRFIVYLSGLSTISLLQVIVNAQYDLTSYYETKNPYESRTKNNGRLMMRHSESSPSLRPRLLFKQPPSFLKPIGGPCSCKATVTSPAIVPKPSPAAYHYAQRFGGTSKLLQRLNAAAPVIFGYNPSGGGGPSPPAFVLPPSPSSAYPSNPSLMTSSGPYVLPPPSISLQPAADGAVAPALVSPPSGIRDFSSNPYVPTSSIGRLSFPFLQNPYLSRSLTHMHPLFPSAYDAGDVPYPTHSYPVQSKAEDPVPVPSDPVSMQLALSARERALKKAVDDQLSFGFKSMPKDGAVVKPAREVPEEKLQEMNGAVVALQPASYVQVPKSVDDEAADSFLPEQLIEKSRPELVIPSKKPTLGEMGYAPAIIQPPATSSVPVSAPAVQTTFDVPGAPSSTAGSCHDHVPGQVLSGTAPKSETYVLPAPPSPVSGTNSAEQQDDMSGTRSAQTRTYYSSNYSN